MSKSYEKARSEIAKQYNKELQTLKTKLKEIQEENKTLKDKNITLEKKVESLEEKIRLFNIVINTSEAEKDKLLKGAEALESMERLKGLFNAQSGLFGVNNKMLR